jgi:malonyl CoA-acyl carrier protein transacylase
MHDIDRNQLELNPETGNFEYEQFEFAGETQELFNEAEQLELAAELLEVRDEQELDRFLGSLIRKVSQVARSPIGQALGGVLKGVAKKALPLAGTALGGFVGGPLGVKIGSGLASMAGNALGLEAEMLNQEDREFEGAKQFVRLAGTAIQSAASAGPNVDPRAAAQSAVTQAAQTLAPGLVQSAGSAARPLSGGGSALTGRSGRWVRRGNRIVLLGV